MRTRRHTSIVANPILVGAVTVLVVIVATYLAYNANNGLPFVPTGHLTIEIANAGTIGRDSEVREGGYRVGVVEGLHPHRLRDGRVVAAIRLKLDRSALPIPDDTTFAVRAKGAIGGKYIELHRGRSQHAFGEGATVALGRTAPATDLDEVLSTFDGPTRAGIRRSLRGLGGGVAFRGPDINAAVAELPTTLPLVESVMRNLADPRTHLRRFVGASARLAGALAPVAPLLPDWLDRMATTLDALSADPEALAETIRRSPATLTAGTSALRTTRPVLTHTAALLDDLQATAHTARSALPPLTTGLRAATPALRQAPSLAADLATALDAVQRLARDPMSSAALRGLQATIATLQPQIRFLGPAETVCNQWTMWATMVPDILSEPDSTGTVLRGIAQTASTTAHDNVATMGANEFATGRGRVRPDEARQDLHADVFADAVENDGTADCELGQQGYIHSLNPYDDTPGRLYRRAVVDPAGIPEQGGGPVFKTFDRQGGGHGEGAARVPAGTTFTREPGGNAAPETP